MTGKRYVFHGPSEYHEYGDPCDSCVAFESRPPKDYYTVKDIRPLDRTEQ